GAARWVCAARDTLTCAPCGIGRNLRAQATIQLRGGAPHVVALIPVSTGVRSVGFLSISAPLASSVLDEWSRISGARVAAVDPSSPSPDPLTQVAHAFPHLELRVSSSLAAELATLAATRRHGALAGLVALTIALFITRLSARDFLRAIGELQSATEQVCRGDLEVRIRSTRTDEIGDVARLFDETLDRLSSSQQRLHSVQRIAHFGDWSADLERGFIDGSVEFANLLGLRGYGSRPLADFIDCFVGADRDQLKQHLARGL